MGKVLVLYYSSSGNTKKMAEFVAEGAKLVEGTELRLKSISEAVYDDIIWCNGLAIGSPTYLGTISAEMKKFLEELIPGWQKLDGRIGCAFSSQGGWGGGAELTCLSILTVLINYGFLVFGLPDYTGERFTAHYGVTQAGVPEESREIEACRRLGRRLAEWVAVFFDGRKDMHPLKVPYKRSF